MTVAHTDPLFGSSQNFCETLGSLLTFCLQRLHMVDMENDLHLGPFSAFYLTHSSFSKSREFEAILNPPVLI